MNKISVAKIASLSAVLVSALSAPAFAGASSYVENDFSVRNIFNGRSSTKVNVNTESESHSRGSTYSSKIGTSHTETNQSTRGDVDGFWTEQTFNEVDSFDIVSRSEATSRGSETSTTTVEITDTFSYNGIDKTHRVTAGFDF